MSLHTNRSPKNGGASGRDAFEICVSQLVLDEAAVGDPVAAAERLEVLKPLPLLDITESVLKLASALLQSGVIPVKSARDAAHIAVGSVHGVDYLMTWNLRAHCQCHDHQNGPNDLRSKWVFMSGDLHTGGADGELAMFHDPIVEEVRAIREQLAAQFNFDIRKIVEDAQRRQATSKSRIVSFQRASTAPQRSGPAKAASNITPSHQASPTAEDQR